MRRFELTDEQFARIAHLLSGKDTDPGRTAVNNRRFVNGVLWILRTGSPWRDLPERFGPWNSVFQRFIVIRRIVAGTDFPVLKKWVACTVTVMSERFAIPGGSPTVQEEL